MAGLIPWGPFRAMRRRDDLFEDLFHDFFRDAVRRTETDGGLLEPSVEVAETEADLVVKMELPGVEKDQLKVNLTDDLLTVKGEVRKETEEKKKNYHRQEIHYGAFQRTVALPSEVDADKVKAELKSGVLTVTMPKSKKAAAHQVSVKVA